MTERSFFPWIAALLLWPAILPFGWMSNTGEFALMASRWASGDVLYRDIADNRPPGIYAIWRLGLAVFGRAHAHVGLELCAQVVTLALLLAIARRLWDREVAWRAGVLYAVSAFAYLMPDMIGESETFAMPLVLATLWLSSRPQESEGLPLPPGEGDFTKSSLGPDARGLDLRCALLGVLAALLFWLKLVPAAIPLAAALWLTRRPRPLGFFAMAFVTMLFPFALVMLLHGSLVPFLRVFAEWRGPGLSTSGLLRRALVTLPFLVWGILYFIPAGIIAILGVVRLRKIGVSDGERAALVLIGAALAVVALQGKFYGYHFLPILPLLALLAGRWWAIVDEERAAIASAGRRRALTALLLAVILGAPVVRRGGKWLGAAKLALGLETRESYDARFVVPALADPFADAETARAVASRVPPEKRVLIWGFAPQVYYLADRAPASRYIGHLPYACANCDPRLQDELMEELRASPPALVLVHVDELDETDIGAPLGAPELLRRFTRLDSWLDERYLLEARIGHFDVYRPRTP